MEMHEEEVVIIGGGIAGLATALAFKRIGVQALVLERWHELRATGAALTLFPNAWRALEALGVAHKLTSIYGPIQKGAVTNVATGATQQISFSQAPSDSSILGVRSVHRKALLEALAEELPLETIRYSSKVVSIKTETPQGSPKAVIHMEDQTVIKAKILIGCDGVHSVVAQWLGLAAPVHSGRWAVRGLATFPQGHGFKHEVQQFLGEDTRAGFSPLTGTEVYWFIVYKSNPTGEDMARDPKLIQKGVLENMANDFPAIYRDVVQHADLSTLTAAPLMFRYPWNLILGHLCKGNITVAGDAMHPMTPDLGQGGCSALEDAVALGRQMGNALLRDGDIRCERVGEALESYVKERRWRAAGLIVGAYLSGWAQQGGSGRFGELMRLVFYRFLFTRLFNAVGHDCGKLPSVSPR